MKTVKWLVFPALLMCFFFLGNTNTTQAQGLELTILPGCPSPSYSGIKTDYDYCGSGVSANNLWGPQATGTGVYYPPTITGQDIVARIQVCDAFGNCVTVYGLSIWGPQTATLPGGETVVFSYFGCNHPSVVYITP